jgi:flagellar L-ring protein precursor FlgH
LKGIGKPPPLSNIPTYPEKIADEIEEEEIAQADANYSLLNPMAYGQETAPATANSLWQPGARKFFRNKNLRSVGDILKVQITIADSASLNNSTNRTRNNTASAGTPTFFGVEKYAQKVVNKVAPDISLTDPVSLRATDSDSGNGAVSRNETIRTTIAASVVRVLPNNNLWIKGSQEVRVNFELREVTIEGMVRQEDITADNSIKLDQIAEARVSYGGRGQISDYQQPRYGKQVFDIISPF